MSGAATVLESVNNHFGDQALYLPVSCMRANVAVLQLG
jgi:hypothetical protein